MSATLFDVTFLSRALACLAAGAVLVGAGTGCSKSEYSILIDAQSVGNLSSVNVRILPMDHSRSLSSSGERAVSRTVASLRTDPLRVAIPFDHEVDVLVQIVGTGGGRVFRATRCYHVDGVVRDVVLLTENDGSSVDGDADGFPLDPSSGCLDPDGSGGTQACDFACPADVASDCAGCVGDSCTAGEADSNASVYPGAPERCENGIDEDCSGEDAPCGDLDGDGSSACREFATPGSCDCDDQDRDRNPSAVDVCGDGIDQDCNGLDALCDRDMDGYPADLEIGGRPDCDDTNASINPGATELCTADGATPADENCSGVTDELASCLKPDLDLDGYDACMDGATTGCDPNDCDPGINPGAPEICGNDIDEDGVGGSTTCSTNDADEDGYVGMAVGGTDCNDEDPLIHPGAGDRCGDSIDQDCEAGDASCDGDTDGDFYVGEDDCDETNAAVNAGVVGDACNGLNDDCDLTSDEVLMSSPISGCVSSGTDGVRAEITFNTILHCGACRSACNPGTETLADVCVPDASAGGAPTCDCSGDSEIGACGGGRSDACCPGNGGCVDLDSNLYSCGSCGNSCDTPMADRCTDGNCACGDGPACSGPGEICCGGACVVPSLDVNNCGACGHVCAFANAGATCVSGDCQMGPCIEGFGDCPGDGAGCGTSLRTAEHCGSCTDTCGTGGSCATGTCQPNDCPANQARCGPTSDPGPCISLETTTNCNGCGTPCNVINGTGSCTGGVCARADCDANFDDCDGRLDTGCETDLRTLSNCGACNNDCNTTVMNGMPACVSGHCEHTTCAPGYRECDSNLLSCEMTDMMTSCNDCGAPCTDDIVHGVAFCAGPGQCIASSCDTGYDSCAPSDGICDSLSTEENCGACGTTCMPGAGETATCATGSCVRGCAGGFADCGGGSGMLCVPSDFTSLAHCTACNTPCDIANASESCASGACHVLLCDPGFGNCDVDSDTCEPINLDTSCGNSCTDCTVGGTSSDVCCPSGGDFVCQAGPC